MLMLLMLFLFLFLFLICFSHNLPQDGHLRLPTAGAVQSSSHTPLTAKGRGKLRRTRQAVSGYR
jgi:hypothetical protein